MAKKFIVTGVEDLGNNQYALTGYSEEALDLENGDTVTGNDDGGIELPKKPPPPEP